MNTKINHQEIPALPNDENCIIILDFIADMCANKKILKEFLSFIGVMLNSDEDFDFHSSMQDGQNASTGLAVSGYAIKFIYSNTGKEEARFLQVEHGKIYKMCTFEYVNSNRFH